MSEDNRINFRTWDEIEKELFTQEEIEACSARVAMIGKNISEKSNSPVLPQEQERLDAL